MERINVAVIALVFMLATACGSSPHRSGEASGIGTTFAAAPATAVPTPQAFAVVHPRIAGSMADSISALAVHGDSIWIAVEDVILRSDDFGIQWRQLATMSAGVTSLAFPAPSEGWAASSAGLLHSSDGGTSWHEVPGRSVPLQRVRFADAQHGWLQAKDGSIERTADGGATWAPGPNPCAVPGHGQFGRALFAFINGRDGWTLCPGVASAGAEAKQLYRTADGGAAWSLYSYTAFAAALPTPSPFGLPGSGYASDLFFLDSAHGWIGEERGGGYATLDGAESWQELPFFLRDKEIDAIAFASASRGVVMTCCGDASTIDATRDGGASWAMVYQLPPVPVPAIATPEPLATFTVGTRETSWATLLPGYRVDASLAHAGDLWVVAARCNEYAVPPEKAAAIGLSGNRSISCLPSALLRSGDGGAHWSSYLFPALNPEQVFERYGQVAVAGGGVVLATSDDGATWTRVRPDLLRGE